MASTSASDQTFKVRLKKTQAQFLVSIRESQEQLRGAYGAFEGYVTSVCIEVDYVLSYYHPSNRGKDMIVSALKAIHTKNGAVDVFFEYHQVMEVNSSQVERHQIVHFKCDTLNDRKRNIAHIHIMKKGKLAPGNADDVCNILSDLSDDSDDDDLKEEESVGVKNGEATPFHDQESIPEKSDPVHQLHGE